mmetsp:Transcript_79879/g.171196  ORF Transcript_79879/g.171196 Transcript_79879/m.171196 type:complete len:225 (+) Transcript_79879:838-1512(+)
MSRCRSGPRQAPPWPRSARASMIPGARGFGTPRREAPVSMMPRQAPLPRHASKVRLPTRTAMICTCQKPSSGFSTGAQSNGEARRAGLWPPKAISPPLAPRKMPNCGFRAFEFEENCPKKLKSLLIERPLRPRPMVPSWGMTPKGVSVISVAMTMPSSVQACRPPASLMQTVSRTKSPAILPSPKSMLLKPMVSASRSWERIHPGPCPTAAPSALISLAAGPGL